MLTVTPAQRARNRKNESLGNPAENLSEALDHERARVAEKLRLRPRVLTASEPVAVRRLLAEAFGAFAESERKVA